MVNIIVKLRLSIYFCYPTQSMTEENMIKYFSLQPQSTVPNHDMQHQTNVYEINETHSKKDCHFMSLPFPLLRKIY